MAVTYTSRQGVTYTLYRVPAAAGKFRHVFARQSKTGEPVDALPPGFRIREDAHAAVSLVKDEPLLVAPEEVAVVQEAVSQLRKSRNYLVVGQHDRIEVYEKEEWRRHTFRFANVPTDLHASAGDERSPKPSKPPVPYAPVLRFVIIGLERREFRPDRAMSGWGRRHIWRWLEQTGTIGALAQAAVPPLALEKPEDPYRFLNDLPTVRDYDALDWKAFAPPVSLPTTSPKSVHRLKITLTGSKPPIWRRVLVPSDITLDVLHHIVQGVMEWDNDHLHQFEVDGLTFTATSRFSDAEDGEEATIRLDQAAPFAKTMIRYRYDFGDSWDHDILVEAVQSPEPGQRYPFCLDGQRAGPPEDCGGIWRYGYLVAARNDPKHPLHREQREWFGKSFDPEAFDLDAINARLR